MRQVDIMSAEGQVEFFVKHHSGCSTHQVSVATGLPYKAAYMSLRRLYLYGNLMKRGGRNGRNGERTIHWTHVDSKSIGEIVEILNAARAA